MYFRFLGELSIWQQLITQMPTGVWWCSAGLSDLSSLSQNHAGFLLCGTTWHHIYFDSLIHMQWFYWRNTPLHSTHQVGVQCLAPCFCWGFFFHRRAVPAPNWPWVTNDANVYDSVSLYEHPCPPFCQQMPFSKAHPADAVELISEGEKTDWSWCRGFSVAMNEHMSGKQRMAHTALSWCTSRTFINRWTHSGTCQSFTFWTHLVTFSVIHFVVYVSMANWPIVGTWDLYNPRGCARKQKAHALARPYVRVTDEAHYHNLEHKIFTGVDWWRLKYLRLS